MTWRRTFLTISLGTWVAAVILYYGWPDQRAFLVDEDRGVEMATVVLYFISAAIALLALIRSAGQRIISVLFLVAAVVGILEETSYGGRLLDYTPPHVFDVKIDAAHDIVLLLTKLLKDAILEHRVLVVIPLLMVVVTVLLVRRYWPRLRQAWAYLDARDATHFLAIFVGLGVIATAVDIVVLPLDRWAPALHDVMQMGEELLEACASLALATGAMANLLERTPR